MNITTTQRELLVEAYHTIFDIKDASPPHDYSDHEHYQVRDTAFNTLMSMDNLFRALGIETISRSDNEGRDGINVPEFVPNMTVKVDDLLPGDVVARGKTITGYYGLVRGGAKFDISYANGSTGSAVYSRRHKMQIMRAEATS